MDATVQESVMKQLFEQAERLRKLVELKAPQPIIANEIALILKSGLVLFPECVEILIGEMLIRQARLSKWICPECGKHWLAGGTTRPMCDDCLTEYHNLNGKKRRGLHEA